MARIYPLFPKDAQTKVFYSLPLSDYGFDFVARLSAEKTWQ